MEFDWNAQLVVWTARLAVGCYLLWAVVFLVSRNQQGATRQSANRWEFGLWACGWFLMAVHIAVVFHVVHDWSHVAAYAHTAQRTKEVTGWNWGGGLYFNYALVTIWGLDVLWRSVSPRTVPFVWTACVQAFLIFMMFNATVVFGPRFWTAIAVPFAVLLLAVAFRKRTD